MKEKNILITAGPTNEYIDEVMKITNMSTGRLGIELTKKFLNEGANVTLIATRSVFRSGLFERYALASHPNLKAIQIETTEDMFNALECESKNKYDLIILIYKETVIRINEYSKTFGKRGTGPLKQNIYDYYDKQETPKKLNIAAIAIAFFGVIALVETHVAIAFGASVQPFTKITPKVSTTAIKRSGFAIICSQKYINDKSMG